MQLIKCKVFNLVLPIILVACQGCWRKSQTSETKALNAPVATNSQASQDAAPPEIQVQRYFQFPSGLTPDSHQLRNIEMIKAKYMPQLFSLHAAQRHAQGHPDQVAAQKKFYGERERQIIAEIQRAIDSLLTPEQRQKLMSLPAPSPSGV